MEFDYRIVTPQGKVQKGTGKANDQEALKADLRAQGFSILDVAPRKKVAQKRQKLSFEPFGVSPRALAFFTRQFSATLRAGLPMLRALATLQQQSSSGRLRKILAGLTNEIQQGQSLYQAMSKYRNTFGDLYLSLIRVGEATGSLDICVSRLAELQEKDLALQRKIRSAMSYPTFVLIFSGVIVYSLVAFLLPAFTPIFKGSGLNIARDYPITQVLITMSRAANNPVTVAAVLVVAVGIYVGLRLAYRFSAGRLVIDSFKYHMPIFHELVAMATLSRFCRTFGILIKSGVPLLEGLTYVGAAAGNQYVATAVQKVSRDVQDGAKLSATLANLPLFPPLVVAMVTIGEETGNVDAMFERMAEFYQEELDAAVSSLTALIEPAMMAFVGTTVCLFVMGILLPILGISSAVQSQM